MIAKIRNASFQVGIKEIIWVICAMVVPLLINFIALSYRIDNVKYEFLTVKNVADNNRIEIKALDDKISTKLDKIISELGIVQGQLKANLK